MLALAEAFGNEHHLPVRILRWTPEQIAAAAAAITERTNGHARP